jgi:two-component system response regulator PilR (NtrC family)
MRRRILVVDDEQSMCEFLQIMLQKEGYSVDTTMTLSSANDLIRERDYQLILLDLKMGKRSGIDLLRKVNKSYPAIQVIVITAYPSAETAVEAMKLGAYDYITKPFDVDELKELVRKALEKSSLYRENIKLKEMLRKKFGYDHIVGKSPQILKIIETIKKIVDSKSTVLICGESGSGKEVIAKCIHYNSPRGGMPFVVVNCSSIPHTLMESELFGHVRGSFTGAVSTREGLFEKADGGTIFLDEVGDIPPDIQVKLLRFLQEKKFMMVGGRTEVSVDVRVIAATNRDIEREVMEGKFREDLYYRLNVIRIDIPPLRERMEDVPLLIEHFIQKYSRELGKNITYIHPEARKHLMKYWYPGNVRELENIIERAMNLESGDTITVDSLPSAVTGSEVRFPPVDISVLDSKGFDLEKFIQQTERKLIIEALRRCNGTKTKAASLLGISFRGLRYKLEKYRIADSEI